jgi:hypothetical protein
MSERPIVQALVGLPVECVVCGHLMVIYMPAMPLPENHPGFMHPYCAPEWDQKHDQGILETKTT